MADNVTLPATGSGTATPLIATDDVGGAQFQQVKLDGGGDGLSVPIEAGQQTMAASLPVVVASDQTAVPISAASLPLPTGASTAALQPGLGTAGSANANVLTVQGIASMTAVQIADNGGSITVDGSVTATQGTASNLKTQATGAGTAGTADTGVLTVQGIASMTPVQVSQETASNLNATVVGTGTFAAQVTAVGTVADDGTTPGAPVMVGGFAKNPDGTDPGSVGAEDDVVRWIGDRNRRQYVNTVHPRFGHKHLDGSTAYTDESIVADPGDGFQTIITNIVGSTGAATALNFFLEEGSTKIFGPIYLEAVAGRGFASGPIFLPVTASTAVTLTSSASIAQSFDIDYFIQAVP